MHFIFLLMTLGACLLVFYEDFKQRMIHISALTLFGLSTIIYSYHKGYLFEIFALNILFLLIVFSILYIYLFLKHRQLPKMLGRYIGLGDIIILALVCTSYSLYNYVILILATCIVGLIHFSFVRFLLNKKIIRIPFAGCLAAVHFILTLFSFIVSFDVTNNNLF